MPLAPTISASRITRRPQSSTGFTLIELIVVVSVLAIIATLAAPNLISLLDNRRLNGAAEAVLAELQFARSEAIMRSGEVTLELPSNGAWLVVRDANNQDIRRINNDDFPRIQIAANETWDDGILMDPVRGLALRTTNTDQVISPVASITVSDPRGRSLEIRLNALGRSWICQPDGSGRYGACT
ncbi:MULTISPECIES: GspH/FimT family pseudopilin [unclassified Thioalkalivibrio]|uniref:GspH/FimT family pseudopilin n=1 Tax=unclassified Thioalkalivibrio TaxID=2621013 RepID=UPI002100E1E3|nr:MULTISPECIES: GspH/FimT family pseudopilin [unclassified Thioalkalivibrio]